MNEAVQRLVALYFIFEEIQKEDVGGCGCPASVLFGPRLPRGLPLNRGLQKPMN